MPHFQPTNRSLCRTFKLLCLLGTGQRTAWPKIRLGLSCAYSTTSATALSALCRVTGTAPGVFFDVDQDVNHLGRSPKEQRIAQAHKEDDPSNGGSGSPDAL